VEVLSQLFVKDGRIYSVSQRLVYRDNDIAFFIVNPPLNYEQAKKITDKICAGVNKQAQRLTPNKNGCCRIICKNCITIFLLLVLLLGLFVYMDVYVPILMENTGFLEEYTPMVRNILEYRKVLGGMALKSVTNFIPNKLLL